MFVINGKQIIVATYFGIISREGVTGIWVSKSNISGWPGHFTRDEEIWEAPGSTITAQEGLRKDLNIHGVSFSDSQLLSIIDVELVFHGLIWDKGSCNMIMLR